MVRAFASAALVAALCACGAEGPGSSDAPPSPDTPADARAAIPESAHAGGSPSAPADTASDEDVITKDGWGPLRIGMTREEVIAAAGSDAQPDAVGGPDPDRCDEFRPSRAPAGLLVMIEDGLLTRISLSRNSEITTPEGLRIGDASSRVADAYGSRASVTPHKYWQSPAKYFTVWATADSSGERRGIRYEVDETDRVAHIHAGGASIEYVEGCL